VSAREAAAERRPLSPEVAARAALLQVRARAAADALLAGHHRSVRHGASAVFVEHREYRPGDDPRRLDWRAFARTDRPTIRHFEHEAQLRATLLFDRSGSMYFADPVEDYPSPDGSATPSKAAHAATLLAAIAYVLMRQGDAFGLTYIDRDSERTHPPRARPDHLEAILTSLASSELPGEPAPTTRSTDLTTALAQVAESTNKHGVVVLASDLLDNASLEPTGRARLPWSEPLALMSRRGQSVLVLHVLTCTELALGGSEPARYEGLEGELATTADPVEVGTRYRERMARFCADAERAVVEAGGRYVLARTDEAPTLALSRLLRPSSRGGR